MLADDTDSCSVKKVFCFYKSTAAVGSSITTRKCPRLEKVLRAFRGDRMRLLSMRAALMRLIEGVFGWARCEIARTVSLPSRLLRNLCSCFGPSKYGARADKGKTKGHVDEARQKTREVNSVWSSPSPQKIEEFPSVFAEALSPEKSPGLSPVQRKILQRTKQLYKTSGSVIRPVNHRAEY